MSFNDCLVYLPMEIISCLHNSISSNDASLFLMLRKWQSNHHITTNNSHLYNIICHLSNTLKPPLPSPSLMFRVRSSAIYYIKPNSLSLGSAHFQPAGLPGQGGPLVHRTRRCRLELAADCFCLQHCADWYLPFFITVSCPSKGHCSRCADKKQDSPARLPRPCHPRHLVYFAWGWVMLLVYVLFRFTTFRWLHILFLWSLSPTPLSIWQIYTPEAQHLPRVRLDWYQMEMFISGFSEQAADSIGSFLLLLKTGLY